MLVNSVMATQLYNNCEYFEHLVVKMMPVLQTKRSNTVAGFYTEGGGSLGSPPPWVPNKYFMYIVVEWHYFGQLDDCFEY